MKKYDYIIIGGGSSGLVTASKLIKHGFNVLIIEEGQKNNNPILKMPAGWIPMLSGSPYQKFYKSIPQKQLNNRQHDIAQAKILGGGSSINGMVYMRGKPSDYKNWKIDTLSKRIISWISNSQLTYDESDENYKKKLNDSIKKQINH